jgi:cytochrome oxidase assembly protein ShyY1
VLDLLRQRRWFGFSVFALAAIIGCLLLSRWQWNRYQARLIANDLLATALAFPSAAVDEVLDPIDGTSSSAADVRDWEWREVTATGVFEPSGEVAVRRRPHSGRNGFWVVTPLRTEGGLLLVNRGWISAGNTPADTAPTAPPPPNGLVEVVGRLRAPEVTHVSEAPPVGQAWAADPAALLDPAQRRFPAYLQMTGSSPAPSPGLTVLDEVPGRRGTNNLIYTGQWLIFAVILAIGWWRMVRQESGLGVDRRRDTAESISEADL